MTDDGGWHRVRAAAMRGILLLLAPFLALSLAPPATEAQQVARPWRLGYLGAGSGPAPPRGFPYRLLVPSNRQFSALRVRLVELAAQARMPAMYDVREYVEAGGLAAYGPFVPDLFSRAAGYVDKILKGRKPADLAVEQPTKFELILNRKTATALGLAFPPSLLLRADHVIE